MVTPFLFGGVMARAYPRHRRVKETDRSPIPQDWISETGGYSFGLICVPDSSLWKAMVRGKLHQLAIAWNWDKNTGDLTEAARMGAKIEGSLCFMSCDELFNALGEIRDAISNQKLSINLSGVETRLQGIETSTSALTSALTSGLDEIGYNVEMVRSTLGDIRDNVQNVANRTDELGTDITSLRDDLANQLLNLSANLNSFFSMDGSSGYDYVITVLKSLSETLVNLQVSIEQMRLYEGTKLDFYGQTMTTQSQELRLLTETLAAKVLQVNLSCNGFNSYQGFIDINPDDLNDVDDDERCLNAHAIWEVHKQAVDALAENLSSAQNVVSLGTIPFTLASDMMGLLQGIITTGLTRTPIDAFELAFNLLRDILDGVVNDWPAVALEFQQTKGDFVGLLYCTSNESLPSAIENYYATLNQPLSTILLTIDFGLVSNYILKDILGGDNSTLWEQFHNMKIRLSDGFDDTLCFCGPT